MRAPQIVDVDDQGERLDGEPMMTATRQAIRAGFMVNVPIVLRYPDGRLVEGHEARVTPKGMAVAAREMTKGEVRH